jgi:hypothetical protein
MNANERKWLMFDYYPSMRRVMRLATPCTSISINHKKHLRSFAFICGLNKYQTLASSAFILPTMVS